MHVKFLFLIGLLLIVSLPTVMAQQAKFTVNGVKVNSNSTINTCINTNVTFNNTVNSSYNYKWKFAGGSPSSASGSQNESTFYATAGTYKVIHSWSVAGSDYTDSVNISVSSTFPKASFTFSPTTLECGSKDFQFTSTSTGTGLTYNWDFGDGTGSTIANPVHQFNKAIGSSGTTAYNVKLTVTNNSLCQDVVTAQVIVKNLPDISLGTTDALIVFAPFKGNETFRKCRMTSPYWFPFVNLSTTLNTSYTINWGEGGSDSTFSSWPSGIVINHLFKVGNTVMTVRIKGNSGCEVEKKYNIFVGSTPAAGFQSLGNTEVCAPDSLRFVISGYSINAPGTTYTVTVNDSTVPISFLHPPMDTVTHWFANSSCGIVSSNGSLTFQNSFRATLDAENPCDITSVSVIPIFVSGKPNPLIGISPSNNVCINSVVTIRNTGDYGGKITSTGGGTSKCENVGKQVWKITPATGYTITSGLLGSLNNATLNGELWTNGTTSLNVTFTVPGIYKVKQYLSNDRCGVDSIEETICVRNPPTASFTMDKKNGCSPAVVNINNTSPVGPCAGEKYNWNVVFSDYENCGSSNGASYTNNTNSTSKNPQISFSKPGRYIIELTVSTAASGCPSPVARDTFYVTAKPTATIPAIAAICAGNTIAPKATVSNCYATQAAAYSWQFTNGVPATSTGADPGSILYNAQGSYAIKLDVTNECGTTTANTTVNITSKPVASAGADKIICSGKTTQLGSTGSGYTYSWKPSTYLNSNTIADPTVTPVYNGPSSDTLLQYVLTVSAGSNCVSTDTVLLTVRRSPVVIVSPTAISICTGGSAQLTASGADTYSWNPASGLNPVNQATVTASPAVSTQYIVTGSLANGCSNTASVNVNVVSFTPANAGADKNYCSGLSTIIGTTGAGMNYSWSPTTGLSDPGNAVTTVNFVNNGNSDTTLRYVLTASAGANCTGTDTVLVTVKRSPKTVVAPLSTDICPGGTAQLVASGGSSYKWTPATGLNFSNKDTVIANPAATQQYTVTGSFSNGCSVDATAIVNVKAKPNVDAGSDTITCKNFPGIQLTGSPGGGSWSGNNFISNAGIFNPLLAGIGTYKAVYAFTANGCNNADSLLITVTNPPVANAGANASYCAGPGTVQLNGTPTGGKWTGSQAVSPSGILQLSTAGSYKLVYNIGNGSCIGTDTVVITIGDAVTNNIISAVQPVCTGNAPATITGAIATAGTYTVSYQWQQSIDSINWSNISGATAKDYSPPILTSTVFYRRLASSSICSQGTPSNEVKAVIHPNAIADFTPLQTSGCTPFQLTPALINLTASPGSNGEYRWLVNNNYIGSGDPFPGYTLSKSADTIQLTLIAVSRFGCFNDTTVKTFTTPRTPVPSFTISDSVGCGPLGITITNTTPDANLFSFGWDFGTGQKSDSVQPGIINFPINPSYGDTVYIVSLKAFTDCDTIEVIKSIRVRAKPKALFTPSKVIGCSPMSVTFTNTSRGSNASFTWDFGDGSPQVPAISTSIQHTFYTGVLDTFYVKLFGKNDCGIDTQQYAIVVNPNAIKLNVAVNGNQVNGCAPHSVLFVNNTKGANLFRWNFGDGSPELTTTKGVDSVLHTYTQTGVYNVSLFATNSCSDTSTTLTITVETGPVVSFSATPTVLCIGQPLSITNTSEAGLAWAWRFGDGSISSVQNPVKSYTTPGNYRIVLTGAKSFAQGFGCADSAVADIIITDTLPGQFTVDSSGSCAPMNVLFKNTSRPSVNTAWNFGDGGTAAGDSVNHVYNLSGIYTAVMVAQAPGGCRYRNEKTIVVNGPSGELLYKGGFVCPPAAVHFEANSNNTSQYRFYPGNGDSAINSTGVLDYTYAKPGRYLPYAVLVTGNCSRIITGTDTVKIEKIQAGFASNSIQQCGSTTVQFTDTSTVYFGITGWDWNFGDGTSSSQKNPSKIFTVSGTYNVRLRITGTSGCSSEVTIPLVVKVNNTPTSQISTGTLRCTDNPTLFTANVNSVDAIETYNWNFGNGSTGSGSSVSYNYSGTGVYTVTLISRTVFGCADTVKQEITINQSPKVSASQDVRICLGQSAPINASGAPQLSWSPQQGLSCTSCASPVATPTLSTLYKVTGVNAIGCPNTDSVLVEVVQPFKISVTPNDTICIGGSSQLFASGAAYYRWNPAIGLNAANIPNPVAKPASTTQYTVIGYDNYSCFTDTAQVIVAVGQYPVVDIGRGSLVVAGTAVQLSPNITNGPISKYNWEPPTWLSCSDCATPVATINNNISYRLTVTNIYGCSGSDTISYQVLCSKDDQVYIPNAFSPDGDGINDVFMVHGKGVLVDYFRVFNRWGQLVFDGGSNYQPNIPQYGWDGKINGKPATQDVYVYMVQVRCTAGGTFTYKGNVSLLYMR